MLSQGKKAGQVSRQLEITEQTYYRWLREHRGLKCLQAKKLKEVEKENARLRRAVADLALEPSFSKVRRWRDPRGSCCYPTAKGNL